MSSTNQENNPDLKYPCPETQGTLVAVNLRFLIDSLTRFVDDCCTVSGEFGRELQAKDPTGYDCHVEFLGEDIARVYRPYRWNELQLRNVKEKKRQAECAKREAEQEKIAKNEENRKRWQLERFNRIQSLMTDLRKTHWLGKLGESVLKMEVECIVDYGADLGNEELMKYLEDNCL